MAEVRSKREIDIAAPPEVVWDVLTDLERWPHWNPAVKSMSFEGPLAPGSEFRWKVGAGTIVSTLERVDPARVVAWRGRTLELFRSQLQKTLDRALEEGLEHLKREAERRKATAS